MPSYLFHGVISACGIFKINSKSLNKRPKGPHLVHLSIMCHFLMDWPGRPSSFSNRSLRHKLGRGRWDFAFCQVSLKSVKQFQKRKQKCLSQSEARAAIMFYQLAEKKTYLVEDISILLLVKFRWIPLTVFRARRSRKCDMTNKNLVEDIEILPPVKFSWIPLSDFGEVENVSANQRPGRPSCFSNRPEKTQTW